MSVQVCQAPIVFPKVHQATTYTDVADALASLENLIDFVYSGITAKITQEKSRLVALSSRVEVAQIKTQRLVGSQNAITVFSPAKYPAPAEWHDPKPVFGDVVGPLVPLQSDVKPPRQTEVLGPSKEVQMDIQEVAFLQKIRDDAEEKPAPSGLGVPKVGHVPSLLLFNSTENVYKSYSPENNLAKMASKLKKKEKEDKPSISLPPVSLITGESMATVKKQVIGWQPGPVDLPDLDFPTNLPLANLADTQWVGKFLPINPSDNVELPPVTWDEYPIYSSSSDSNAPPSGETAAITTQPVYTQPVNTQSVNTQPVNTQPVNTQSAHTQPVNTHVHYQHLQPDTFAHSAPPSNKDANIYSNPVPNPANEVHEFYNHEILEKDLVANEDYSSSAFPDPSTIPPPLTEGQTYQQELVVENSQQPAQEKGQAQPKANTSHEGTRSFLDDIPAGRDKLRPVRPLESDKKSHSLFSNKIEAIRKAVEGEDTASEASEDWDF